MPDDLKLEGKELTLKELRQEVNKQIPFYCIAPSCLILKRENDQCIDKFVPFDTIIPRPLNYDEKAKANELVHSYSKDIFYLLIEENEKEYAEVDKKREIQGAYITGQTFINKTSQVIAEITEYGDIEIRYTTDRNTVFYDKNCLKTTINVVDKKQKCIYPLPCQERKNEYLMADKAGVSGCTKLKELRKLKKNIELILYTDGALSIRDGATGGILFFEKPTIKGEGPFTVGVSSDLELLVLDSHNIAVWKSTPVMIRDVSKVF